MAGHQADTSSVSMILNFFKRRQWRAEVIGEMTGSFVKVVVRVRNLPCLFEASSGKHRYHYKDFGSEFIEELTERQLPGFEELVRILNAGAAANALVRLRELGPIEVQVTGKITVSSREFYSDLADALVEAFKTHQLGP